MNQLLHVSLSSLSDDQQSYFVLDSEADLLLRRHFVTFYSQHV